MVELVDTRDLKSLSQEWLCGFESRSRHFSPLSMKNFLCILSVMVMLTACGVDGNHFKLSGRFLNMNQGEFYVYSPEGGVDGIDTIRVMGGRFTYERPCEREAMLMLVFPNFSEQPIFAEPGKSVDIKADASHMKEMEVKGTKSNELMTKFRMQTAKMSPPDVVKKAEEFITQHPESPIGMFLVRKYFIQKADPDYTKAEQLTAKMLEKQPKNGPLIILHKQVAQLKHVMAGASMPRFSGPKFGGGTVTEADLGNDVAVLFAWGSWSFESQEMQRQLRRMERSSGGRLKCVGICIDADKTACKKVLERDTITSPVIFDGKLLEGTTFRQVGLSGVPDNIIYRHGRVVARGVALNELKNKIEELLK